MKRLHGKRKLKKMAAAALQRIQIDARNRHGDIVAHLEQISDTLKRIERVRHE